MELLTELMKLNENKIIDRRLLGRIKRALEPLGPRGGVDLQKVEEFPRGRFQKNIEGEGILKGMPSRSFIKKAEDALEKFAFDELVFPGQTVMGADITIDSRPGNEGAYPFEFIIELDQD